MPKPKLKPELKSGLKLLTKLSLAQAHMKLSPNISIQKRRVSS